MDIFGSIFGIDITGDGNADVVDDMIILDSIEKVENGYDPESGDADDVIDSGMIDMFLDE